MPVYPGERPGTIGLGTGLAWPAKAERARANRKVCLFYSEPTGLPGDAPPVVLIYGQATVRDADLQAGLDRHLREIKPRVPMLQRMPSFIIRRMSGYLSRVWIEVTPLRALWWPDADLEKSPIVWEAPRGTSAPPSDPPPKPYSARLKPMNPAPTDWRKDIAYALDQLSLPVLTVVDDEGYPVPFRARSASVHPAGMRLEMPAAAPVRPGGRACLTFHTVYLRNGEQIANENMFFIGDVEQNGDDLLFKVERQLASISAKFDSPRRILAFFSMIRSSAKRAQIEAARRGQPAPTIG